MFKNYVKIFIAIYIIVLVQLRAYADMNDCIGKTIQLKPILIPIKLDQSEKDFMVKNDLIIFDSMSIRLENCIKKIAYLKYHFPGDVEVSLEQIKNVFKYVKYVNEISIIKPSNQGGIKIFKEKDGKLVEVDEQDKVIRVIE